MKRCTFAIAAILLLATSLAAAQAASQLRFCLRSEPKTFNPLLVEEDSSDTVRYLTGGVLVRLNRQTQKLEPALASSWQVSKDGRTITFYLRDHIRFSDGTPFLADDVAFTVQQMMDPKLHSSVGDTFRSGDGKVETRILSPIRIAITFSSPVAGLDRLFDQVAIMSSKSPKKEMAVLGPYYVAENKAGSYLLLQRNPNFWRHDASGRQLPYIDSIRLDIQQNRDLELLRFLRSEIDFVNTIDAESYEKLSAQRPELAHDAGESLDSEHMWFNQVPSAPIADYKKAWFQSVNFRRAVSESINRQDLARIAFRGHARPAIGIVSPANQFWFNSNLQTHPFDPQSALKRLKQDGFYLQARVLHDKNGHPVEFSIITNAGNSYRERMATMIQQDLASVGMQVNVVTLDFPSLIERITRNFNYEACLLGLVNTDLDPAEMMNVWLSSGENHQWNPSQRQPATAWEAEIDRLMRAQGSTLDNHLRKEYFDRVQEIAWEQEPFIYLVTKNSLSAVSKSLENAHPVVLRPQVFWNADELKLRPELAGNR
jgi:peptide/nickel transport system substrate-binding protein